MNIGFFNENIFLPKKCDEYRNFTASSKILTVLILLISSLSTVNPNNNKNLILIHISLTILIRRKSSTIRDTQNLFII